MRSTFAPTLNNKYPTHNAFCVTAESCAACEESKQPFQDRGSQSRFDCETRRTRRRAIHVTFTYARHARSDRDFRGFLQIHFINTFCVSVKNRREECTRCTKCILLIQLARLLSELHLSAVARPSSDSLAVRVLSRTVTHTVWPWPRSVIKTPIEI